MRIILFFDLPTLTSKQKRAYSQFRKFLIKNGFFMMQQSVYSRIVLNYTIKNLVLENIKKNKPPEGLVQVITVTEKQFSKMEYIVGTRQTDIIDTDTRLSIL